MPASYATVEDVLSRYPLISSMASVTSSQIAAIISAEQTIIDAKLAHRYTVPFAPVPAVIQTIAGDLATYRLLLTRAAAKRTDKEASEAEPFKRSLDLLDDIAAGTIDLISSSGTALASTIDPLPWGAATGTPLFVGQAFEDVLNSDLYDNWRTSP